MSPAPFIHRILTVSGGASDDVLHHGLETCGREKKLDYFPDSTHFMYYANFPFSGFQIGTDNVREKKVKRTYNKEKGKKIVRIPKKMCMEYCKRIKQNFKRHIFTFFAKQSSNVS